MASRMRGFPTPSRKLEFFSQDAEGLEVAGIRDSGLHAEPRSSRQDRSRATARCCCCRRSACRRWSIRDPATPNGYTKSRIAIRCGSIRRTRARFGVATGDLLKVHTEIGYFVDKVWVTEGIRPGVIACSHHLGRWRLQRGIRRRAMVDGAGGSAPVEPGKWMMRQIHGVRPFASADQDSARVWWEDAGVHQNLTFPVQPDPISGAHCWHQKVRVERPGPGRSLRRYLRRYGQIPRGVYSDGWR